MTQERMMTGTRERGSWDETNAPRMAGLCPLPQILHGEAILFVDILAHPLMPNTRGLFFLCTTHDNAPRRYTTTTAHPDLVL
jgi:hypothetical protein